MAITVSQAESLGVTWEPYTITDPVEANLILQLIQAVKEKYSNKAKGKISRLGDDDWWVSSLTQMANGSRDYLYISGTSETSVGGRRKFIEDVMELGCKALGIPVLKLGDFELIDEIAEAEEAATEVAGEAVPELTQGTMTTGEFDQLVKDHIKSKINGDEELDDLVERIAEAVFQKIVNRLAGK